MTHKMHKRFNFKGALGALMSMALVSTGVLAMAPAANAVRPGANGRIAFLDPAGCGPIQGVQGYNVAYKAPDGSGAVHAVTSTCDYADYVSAASNPNAPGGPSWNPTGTALVAHRLPPCLGGFPCAPGVSGLWVIPLINGNGGSPFQIFQDPTIIAGGPGTSHDPAWSPKGDVVAFALTSGTGVPSDSIFTVPAGGGGGVSKIASTLSGAPADDPAYDPTGNCVAFVDRIPGPGDPIETQCAGGSAVTRTGHTGVTRNSPTWAPDGTRIAFDFSPAVLGTQIAYVTLGNLSETGISGSAGLFNPAWSPNNLLLAADNGPAGVGIVVGPVTGGFGTVLDPIPGAIQPDWETVAAPAPPTLCDNDADGDGVKNGVDNDDDNDGVLDANDTDDDGDGIADATDTDTDSDCDGISNNVDGDDDNDGVLDVDEDNGNGNGNGNDNDNGNHHKKKNCKKIKNAQKRKACKKKNH
jgi:WD40 repeat protein